MLYDDGESESNVDASLIRAVEAAAPAPTGTSGGGFAKGQKIEARYGGKRRHYPGTIASVGGDGTYEVLYDDGESESNVAVSLIRVVESAAAGKGSSSSAKKKDGNADSSKLDKGEKMRFEK